ncbi:MAG: lipase family protein, partial [Candidatus Nanopelagicales bacterium]
IRTEPLGVDVPGGTGFRVLYSSVGQKGEPVAVSGMMFVSNKPAPPGGRPVIGWAHGTVGLAPQCAPSRSSNVLGDTDDWLNIAMDNGYAVAATDYLGLGTPGPKTYLIGEQEAADVVNSVRALRNFEPSQAGKRWIVWGHSQGGHSSLWTGQLAEKIAPELDLIAVGAAAPAAELMVIMQNQWRGTIGWVIGPEALVSFKDRYPDRDFDAIISDLGKRQLDKLLGECTTPAALDGTLYEKFGGQFFKSSPVDSPAWAQTGLAQTPKPLPPSMPLFMSEGTADTIVLSGSNALMQEEWCAAGSDMAVQWLGGVGHLQVAIASGPTFMEWAVGQFGGKKAPRNCTFPPAGAPYPQVTIPPEVLAAPITQGTSDTTQSADPPPGTTPSPSK